MSTFANLELYLRRAESTNAHYRIDARFMGSSSEADIWDSADMDIDLDDLRGKLDNHVEYGRALGARLFADAAIKEAYIRARERAEADEIALRVILHIDDDLAELHALRWELLYNPEGQRPLFTDENVFFSRFLPSRDRRRIRLGTKDVLRVLVVVANPTDLDKYKLAPIQVDKELERIAASMESCVVETLASGGQATLDRMLAALREERDVLYLVAHGRLVLPRNPGAGEPAMAEPQIWLEDDKGQSAVVSGAELARRMAELQHQPRLVVLDSCQSAGSKPGSLPLALGPRLIDAGIPAVLAMSGNITMDTSAVFMPAFFADLRKTGQIEHAVAVARGKVRDRHDFWVPILLMRLRSGRLWHQRGLSVRKDELAEKWDSLITAIQDGTCIPIVGPELLEPYVGQQRTLARRLAGDFPLEKKEVLPAVAQYLLVEKKRDYMNKIIGRTLYNQLARRFANLADVPKRGSDDKLWRFLDDQVQAASSQLRGRAGAFHAHDALAALDLSYYITTNPFSLIEEALAAAGKRPTKEICHWNYTRTELAKIERELDTSGGEPTREGPLVYHLLGHTDDVDGIVFTEDDYFDFLIQFAGKDKLIPEDLKAKLLDNSLLLLGFHMDDWSFRTMLRTILNLPGKNKLRDHVHVAAQFVPEIGHDVDPDDARKYLEDYFTDIPVKVYWGSLEEFFAELSARLEVA